MAIFAPKSQISATVQHTLTVVLNFALFLYSGTTDFYTGKVTHQKIDLSRHRETPELRFSPTHNNAQQCNAIVRDTCRLLNVLCSFAATAAVVWTSSISTKRDSTWEECSRAQLSVTTDRPMKRTRAVATAVVASTRVVIHGRVRKSVLFTLLESGESLIEYTNYIFSQCRSQEIF